MLTVVAALMIYINNNFLKLPKAIVLTILSITFSALCASFLSPSNFLLVALSSFDFKKTGVVGVLCLLFFANALDFKMLD
ncbi:sodium:proton antiporter, partial [Francisella tularensis subsp. holarctica]|nr:sodium:proton antiporter [Francisella tularensis subsp. holarctica]